MTRAVRAAEARVIEAALAVETNVVGRQAGQNPATAASKEAHAAGLVVPTTPYAVNVAEGGDAIAGPFRSVVTTGAAHPPNAAVFQSKHSTAELVNRARCPMDADYTMSQSIYEVNGWPLWRVTCVHRRKP